MLNDRIAINREFGTSLVKFFGNPIFSFGLATLSAVFFLVISNSQKLPYYYLTQPKLEATQTIDNLKLEFDHELIKNLYSIDLVLWNNGSDFIDQSDFIDSKPINLTSKDSIRFLASKILVKSRSDLNFSSRISPDTLHINMIGDEAIEQGDGAVFRIYYTSEGHQPSQFLLSSRIKGTKLGFEYKDLRTVRKSRHGPIVTIGWSVIILAILIRIVMLRIFKRPVVFRKGELIIILLALCVWSYYTYEYLYLTVELEWLTPDLGNSK